MSDCSTRAFEVPDGWRRLPGGGIVNMPRDSDPHEVDVETARGAGKRFVFATEAGDRVTRVTVDGDRWGPLSEPDWDDLGITD